MLFESNAIFEMVVRCCGTVLSVIARAACRRRRVGRKFFSDTNAQISRDPQTPTFPPTKQSKRAVLEHRISRIDRLLQPSSASVNGDTDVRKNSLFFLTDDGLKVRSAIGDLTNFVLGLSCDGGQEELMGTGYEPKVHHFDELLVLKRLC